VLVVDLNAAHEGADDVAPHAPIRLAQPVPDSRGEGLQLADDKVEGASLLGRILERRGLASSLAIRCRSPAIRGSSSALLITPPA